MNNKDNIVAYIKNNKKAKISDLSREIGISRQMLHRHLNSLVDEGVIVKVGKAPLVFYEIIISQPKEIIPEVDEDTVNFINQRYLWISPLGEMFYGFEGFKKWSIVTKTENQIVNLAREYVKIEKTAEQFKTILALIDATKKVNNTFDHIFLKKMFYIDFYSLPKFGKTKMGQLVLHAKQGQSVKYTKVLAKILEERIYDICKKFDIDAIAFIPPTVPRNYQFLKEIEKLITINLPKIDLTKSQRGEIPIAQKTLTRLSDRIENARGSIYINGVYPKDINNVLIVDDAVGSGASQNEVAKKLKEELGVKNVFGLAIVGSYNGFDVINEV